MTDLTAERWWFEFDCTGSGPTTLEARAWKDGDSRPVSADHTETDSTHDADGTSGLTATFWGTSDSTDTRLDIHSWEVWDLGASGGSFTADAVIAATQAGSLTADAVVLVPQSGSLTADAIVRSTQSGSLTADAWVQPFFTADAYILGGTTGSFTADAVIEAPTSSAFAVDAILLDTSSQSFQADALVLASTFGQLDADAIVLRTQADSLGVAAVLRAVVAGQFDLDAVLRVTNTGAFTNDATILATAAGSMSADAVISLVGRCTWTTPADTVQMDGSPVLAFNMPDVTSGDMHFQIEIDEDSGFGSPIVYQSPGTGWEYWDGGTWQPIPASGVPAVYVGNEARYAVQTPLANGTWYRRVRAGVI